MSIGNGTGRIAVLAGVYLDRAWPELGPAAGAARRDRALPALIAAVREAREQQAMGLVVLGGLTSRATIMPVTLQAAWRVLEAFARPVMLVPGPDDWWDDQSPYGLLPPPANVAVVMGRNHCWDKARVAVATSAVTAPGSRAALPRSVAESADVVALPTWADGIEAIAPPAGGLIVATDDPVDKNVPITIVPSLCFGGDATFLVVDTNAGGVERRTVANIGVQDDVMDVTSCTDSSALQEEVDRRVTDGFGGRLRLTGTLQSGIVLPNTAEFEGWLDIGQLDFALDDPDPRDQSARAEFVRGLVADVEQPERVRHQAIAHGLAALSAKEDTDAS